MDLRSSEGFQREGSYCCCTSQEDCVVFMGACRGAGSCLDGITEGIQICTGRSIREDNQVPNDILASLDAVLKILRRGKEKTDSGHMDNFQCNEDSMSVHVLVCIFA